MKPTPKARPFQIWVFHVRPLKGETRLLEVPHHRIRPVHSQPDQPRDQSKDTFFCLSKGSLSNWCSPRKSQNECKSKQSKWRKMMGSMVEYGTERRGERREEGVEEMAEDRAADREETREEEEREMSRWRE
ncbi:hypothetical protein QQP08_014596 [Theobroma cacao]|nr:hypothetical protein QQP08_014596 [Theobroma cacao]